MTKVSGDELEPVMQCRRGDLNVGIGKNPSLDFELSPEFAEDPGRRDIVGKDRDGRENPLFDVLEMSFASFGAKCSLEEFSDADGTRELVLTRDCTEPLQIKRIGFRAEELRDRVGVEEKGHRGSVQTRGVPSSDTAGGVNNFDELFRTLPSPSQARESSLRAR
jgi:hypothetical protein